MKKTSTAPPLWEEYCDHFSPLQVEISSDSTSDFEYSLRNFKALVQKSKILTDFKERQSYEKPSERKRRKKREMLERLRLLEIKEKLMSSGEWDSRQKKRDAKKKEKIERYRKEAEESK